MIQFDAWDDYGETIVVDEAGLHQSTSMGWSLRAMVSETTPETIPVSGSSKYVNGEYTQDPDRYEVHLQTKTRYILARTRDDTLKKVAAQLHRAERDKDEALQAGEENVKKLKSLEAEVTKNTQAITGVRKELNAAQVQVNSLTDIHRQALAEAKELKVALTSLQDRDALVKRLHTFEDLVIQISQKVDLKTFGLEVPASLHPKTWAERLLEEE